MIKCICNVTVSALVAIMGLLFASPSYAIEDETIDNENIVTEADCLPAILLFRGSGEYPQPEKGKPLADPEPKKYYQKLNGQESHFITTNHYEGWVLENLLTSFVNQTSPAFTVSKTRFIGVKYEALPVFPVLNSDDSSIQQGINIGHHVVKYQDSYNNGARKAVEFIQNDIRNGCNTTYMFAGYSQGAISARIALEMLGNNEEKVVSTYLVGDPVNDAERLLSNRQASPAHNREDSDGVLRYGLELVAKSRFFSDLGEGAQNYLSKFESSDSIVYRDNSFSSSRVLCHDGDLICDFDKESNMGNHMNYFQAKLGDPNSSGNIDLQYEINEFDKQVQNLAISQTSNPRARVLKKTPSVNTSTTLYNLANSQPGDTCSWDEGNNGTYELTDVPCEIYEYENMDKTEKMRVKVTDSYGSNYFFELEDEVLEVEQIEHILTLDPNSWYQFKSKSNSVSGVSKCVDWYWQEPTQLIYVSSWNMDLADCKTNLQGGNAYDALQVFKPSKEGIKSGYDDDYSWNQDEVLPEYLSITPHEYNNDSFKPVLTEIINNTPYYSFRNQDDCVTATNKSIDYTKLSIKPCDSGKDTQLFEAKLVNGDFGALSMEKDTTPPKVPTNFLLEVDNNGWGSLIWDKVEDRGIETYYEIYQLSYSPINYEPIGYINQGDERIISTSIESLGDNETITYSIRTHDEVELYSPYTNLTLTRPNPVKKPAKPVLLNIGTTNITLTLPVYDTNEIRGVRVYNGDEYLGTFTSNSVTLPVLPGTTHKYSYRYEVTDQIVSVKSNILKVVIP